MELISTERAKAAKELIARLLSVARVCARVHAIMHEVRDPPRRAGGKGRKHQAPTGDYLVQLFSGGRIPAPAPTETDYDDKLMQVNGPLLKLVQEATAADTSDIRDLAAEAASLVDLKRVDRLISDLEKANTFRFYASGPAFLPQEGSVTFRGSGAEVRANRFCTAVNKHLKQVVEEFDRSLRSQIVEALSKL